MGGLSELNALSECHYFFITRYFIKNKGMYCRLLAAPSQAAVYLSANITVLNVWQPRGGQ
jgi:hypothetical protein